MVEFEKTKADMILSRDEDATFKMNMIRSDHQNVQSSLANTEKETPREVKVKKTGSNLKIIKSVITRRERTTIPITNQKHISTITFQKSSTDRPTWKK